MHTHTQPSNYGVRANAMANPMDYLFHLDLSTPF